MTTTDAPLDYAPPERSSPALTVARSLAGLAVVVFVIVSFAQARKPTAQLADFGAYYRAGQAVAAGRSPYTLDPRFGALGAYMYCPAFAHWACRPLAHLSYVNAMRAFLAVNWVVTAGAVAVSLRLAGRPGFWAVAGRRRRRRIVPVGRPAQRPGRHDAAAGVLGLARPHAGRPAGAGWAVAVAGRRTEAVPAAARAVPAAATAVVAGPDRAGPGPAGAVRRPGPVRRRPGVAAAAPPVAVVLPADAGADADLPGRQPVAARRAGPHAPGQRRRPPVLRRPTRRAPARLPGRGGDRHDRPVRVAVRPPHPPAGGRRLAAADLDDGRQPPGLDVQLRRRAAGRRAARHHAVRPSPPDGRRRPGRPNGRRRVPHQRPAPPARWSAGTQFLLDKHFAAAVLLAVAVAVTPPAGGRSSASART